MTVQTDTLGGRLPLLDPASLDEDQRRLYDRIDATLVPWANAAHFEAKTGEKRLIGPFNPVLLSPRIGWSFLDLQAAEQRHTTLDERVRQVVILAVGSVWKASYELYAHVAVARQAGLSEAAARALAAGLPADGLREEEAVAYRYARQLSADHAVDPQTYGEAKRLFRPQGLADITFLVGIYHVVCALLNAFEIPAPDPAGA